MRASNTLPGLGEASPGWVSHGLTASLAVVAVLAMVGVVSLWLLGMYPAYLCVSKVGTGRSAPDSMRWLLSDAVFVCACVYLFASWLVVVGGFLLQPVGWFFQTQASRWPVLHSAARAAHVVSILMFLAPLGVLALELLLTWMASVYL